MGLPTATVQMKGPDGLTRIGVGFGTGPVDAAYKAVDSLVDVDCELMDYGWVAERASHLICYTHSLHRQAACIDVQNVQSIRLKVSIDIDSLVASCFFLNSANNNCKRNVPCSNHADPAAAGFAHAAG